MKLGPIAEWGLNLNKKHILDFDLIVINKSVFFDSIFSENIL